MRFSVRRVRVLRRGTKASMEANLVRVRRLMHEAELSRRLQYNPPPSTDIDAPGLPQSAVTVVAPAWKFILLKKTETYD
jgi:hypothetical protein